MSAAPLLLALSLAVQLAAVVAALCFIPFTGRRRAWALISAGLLLMVLRRLLSLGGVLGIGEGGEAGSTLAESVALGSSLALLAGVSLIGRVFRQARSDAASTALLTEELRLHRDRLEELVRERTATLRDSEERFRALAESSADVIMRFDQEGRHLYANPVVQSQTGIPAGTFLGKTHAELGFPSHLVELWEGAIRQVFTTGRQHRVEFQLPSGIWIDWLLIPELAGDGVVRTVITTARDITERKATEKELQRHRDRLEELVDERTADLEREVAERKRTERALRESEERFRSLYDNVGIGLYRTTPEGKTEMANPAFVRMLGFSSFAELEQVDLNSCGFFDSFTRADFGRIMEERGEVVGFEYTLRRADGGLITVREHARAVRDPGGGIACYEGTLEDVTEEKALQEQLRQAQRMEAIGQLAGGIAHDFNNLLMAVMGSAELLERRLHLDDEAKNELGIVKRSIHRANDLIRGLLAFARCQVLSESTLDLNQVVSDLLPILRRMIPENIAINFVSTPTPAAVRADRSNLVQVLMNLAVNARDAMPDGGVITIQTEETGLPPEQLVAFPWAGPGRYVELSFADTGSGMDGITLARIFEPFFTTKDPGRGTGMGLATVYGIVRQHGGIVTADSAPGQGSVFRVALPLVTPEPDRATPRVECAPSGGTETVLVAEDDPEVRAILVDALSSLGYSVLAAGDGREALELLRRHGDRVDLVLTDLIMPCLGGLQLYETTRELAPRVRFLFSSGYADGVVRADLLTRGDVGFIAKPFRVDTLARKVREVLTLP